MDALTKEQRTLRARVAAHEKHAKHDPAEHCAAMRAALWEKYRHQVDPTGMLDEAERNRRARCAMEADLARRRLAAAKARAGRADEQLANALLEVS